MTLISKYIASKDNIAVDDDIVSEHLSRTMGMEIIKNFKQETEIISRRHTETEYKLALNVMTAKDFNSMLFDISEILDTKEDLYELREIIKSYI